MTAYPSIVYHIHHRKPGAGKRYYVRNGWTIAYELAFELVKETCQGEYVTVLRYPVRSDGTLDTVGCQEVARIMGLC